MRKYIIITLVSAAILTLYLRGSYFFLRATFTKVVKTKPVPKSLVEPQKIVKKPFDPFAYSFLQVKNHLISRREQFSFNWAHEVQ